jgi:hypothetical protein
MHTPPPPGSPLTTRAALIVLASIVAGLVAGMLGYLANQDVPTAILIGGGATGNAIIVFYTVLDR